MSLYQAPIDGVVLCNAPLYHAGPLAMCFIPFACGEATGKLPKRELRAPYWEGWGRSI